MKNTILTLSAIFFLLNVSVSQTNYYVSNNGNNSNSGTSAELAWQSINFAAQNSLLEPGDTVNILAGMYNEQVEFTISGAPDYQITFKNYMNDEVMLSGSALPAYEYIMKIESREHIRIVGLKFQDYQQLDAIGLLIINSSYIYIEDNEFTNIDYSSTAVGQTPSEDQNSQPIVVFGREPENINVSQGLVFLRNKIYDCETGWSEALSVNGNIEGFEIAYNEIYNNTNIGIVAIGYEGECPNPENDQARNGHIHHNIVRDNPSAYAECAGIYIDGAAQMNIENNILYNNDYGIEVGCENNGGISGANANNIIVRNNLIYNNTYTGIALGGYDYPTSGYVEYVVINNNTLFNNDTENNYQGEMMISYTEYSIIENNIFYANNADNVLFTCANGANTVSLNYNLFYTDSGSDNIVIEWNGTEFNTFADYRAATTLDANSIFTDPLFVDNSFTNPDLHLLPNSPAINAGNPSLIPEGVDMDDEPRINQGRVDIGADEYYTTTSIINSAKYKVLLCYPNPTLGQFKIDLSENNIQKITVADLSGKVLITKTVFQQNSIIDLSEAKNGIYIVRIQTEKDIFTAKIIKK